MKRIVGLWKENSKLLPLEFSDSIYSSHFTEVEVTEQVASSPQVNTAKLDDTATNESESISNFPVKGPDANAALLQNLPPVDPSAIAG